MKSKLLMALVAGLFSTGAVLAQSTQPSQPAPDRAAKMQEHFAKLDKNGDGAISREEAAGHKHLAKMFDQIDADKDGKITAQEMQAHHAAMHQQHQARFDEAFKKADKNNDGVLTKAEAADSGMPGLAKHFDRLDTNKDGSLSKEELKAAHAAMGGGHGKHGDRMARFEEMFKAADKDGDGALTKAEADAAKMQRIVRDFDRIDANKDGKVTRDELKTAMSQHMGKHHEGGQAQPDKK